MSDPLTRPAAKTPADAALLDTMPLFAPRKEERQSTSQLALSKAHPRFGERRKEIIDLLERHGPMAIFEIAEKLGVPDHTISGRFSAMVVDGLIEKTGERKKKPDSNCACDIYRRVHKVEV